MLDGCSEQETSTWSSVLLPFELCLDLAVENILGISGPWRAEVMPPLGSWALELRTVLCCTSGEEDGGLPIPRILLLLFAVV